MTISEKIEYIWNKAYTDALGAGHATPSDYAEGRVASLRAELKKVERYQNEGKKFAGSRAGRRQEQLRRSR